MYKIPDNCEDCFAFSICAETNIRGKGVCSKFYKQVEEKFTSTNKQSTQKYACPKCGAELTVTEYRSGECYSCCSSISA